MLKRSLLLLVVSLFLASCNFAVNSSTPTLTPPPTLTPSPTATASPSATPTVTPSPTVYVTPSITPRPSETPLPTETPPPTPTAYPAVNYANDQWTSVDIPDDIRGGLDRSWFSILGVNVRTDTTNLATPIAPTDEETLYLVNPSSGQLVSVLGLPASTEGRVYWAPDGTKLLYFMEPTLLENNVRAGGLYLLNLGLEISLRLFNITSLNPRDIPEHRPVWSPDSSQFAIALPTAYDVDIFIVSADGSVFKNATGSGSYDLWPAWSPDGQRLAFVSDRNTCPTWTPNEPGTCASLNAEIPNGGNLFVMDVETGRVQQVSDEWLDGPPTWISNLQIAFTTGLSDPTSPESHILVSNFQSGTVREISDPDGSLNLGATWSPGGLQVLYHRVSDPAALILKDASGNLISEVDNYVFSRFGFAAAWSPGGEYMTFGGRNGQCPYGLIVTRNDFSIVYGPATDPPVCDPSYSPDGLWLAFAGIRTRPGVDDGRLDLYMAQPNGYGSRNLTSSLRGEVKLLGWVGPTSPQE